MKAALSSRVRRNAALEVLGITKEDVDRQPQISHLYKRIGGIKTVLTYLRGSADPDARKIVELADRLGSSAMNMTLETYCAAAEIPTSKLAGIITTAMIEQNSQEAISIAAHHQPEIVAAQIKMAKRMEGEGDRKMLHQHSGFLPTPKNQVIFGGVRVDNRDQSQKTMVLSNIEDSVKKLGDRFNERMLGAPAQPLLPAADDVVVEAEE